MPKIIGLWQTHDGLSRVSLHGTPHENCVMHTKMCRQMPSPTHILKETGRLLFHHTAKFWYLHGSWFLIFLGMHLSGTGILPLVWSPSSVESGMIDPVGSGLTSLHCFDSEQGVSSS